MLSGGLDSATCLYWAKNEMEQGRFLSISAITFNYFGRLANEKKAATNLAKEAGIDNLVKVDVPFLKESADFYNGKTPQRDGANGGDGGMWSSYIPARNMIFYSIAAHYAEFLGIRRIVGGHNLHDVSFFKDASKGYFKKINSLLREGCLLCNGDPCEIVLPLADMDRTKIVKLAIELGVPVDATWSCHHDGKRHCGKCYACRQRLAAFGSIGMKDPVFAKI